MAQANHIYLPFGNHTHAPPRGQNDALPLKNVEASNNTVTYTFNRPQYCVPAVSSTWTYTVLLTVVLSIIIVIIYYVLMLLIMVSTSLKEKYGKLFTVTSLISSEGLDSAPLAFKNIVVESA